jgi:exopolysaccharide biosynthesis protein
MSKRLAIALPAFLLLLLLLPAVQSGAATRYTVVSNVTVAPGLTYKAIKDSRGPNRIFELIVDRAQALTVDTALAGNSLGHLERTTSMASRHGAIAAINGDFSGPSGYPMDRYAEDGDFKISSVNLGTPNFAVSKDEASVFMQLPTLSLSLFEVDTAETWKITRWNYSKPPAGEMGVYTPAGGSFAVPPGSSCYARIKTGGALAWGPSQVGITRSYVVDQAVCQTQAPTVPADGAVLAAAQGTAAGNELATLSVGETVRLGWSFGFRGVLDVIGGYPMLMSNGVVVAKDCTESLCMRHPRTAVGIRADGKLLLVVVDGRQTGWSVGMTLVELANLMKYLGAATAMNMDGGGSSTMVVKGVVKNRPSDGTERAVTNSILILPGADTGEPTPTAAATSSTSASSAVTATGFDTDVVAARRSGLAAALDAGSTGGYLEALARGLPWTRAQTLSPGLLRILERFTSSLGAPGVA